MVDRILSPLTLLANFNSGGDGVPQQQTTSLTFDVDAALLVELGERLVARRSVALAELIKNAYDADATEVTVRFKNVRGPDGEITVSDNGSGMTLEAMKLGWMRIATTIAKVDELSRRFGRPKTGAKGVGRFACRRLALRLALETTSSLPVGSERITAEFDWSDFKPGLDISEIKTTVTRESVPQSLATGTTLRLSALADTWRRQDIAEIQSELADLLDPHDRDVYVRRNPGYDADPGFNMKIEVPEFPEYEGTIEDRFLEAAWGVLRGTVSDDGQPEYRLSIRNSPSELRHSPSEFLFPDLAGAEFTVRMMVYSGSHFRGTGFRLGDARNIGRERGGVRIYLDRFQVFSYGAPGDDWLGLDQDGARRLVTTPVQLAEEARGLRRPMLSLPGNMQLFGSVAISRDRNPKIGVSISRERLVQNESFNALKTFVRSGIDWMTVWYAREVAESKQRGAAAQEEPGDSTQALRSVRSLVAQETGIASGNRLAIESALDDTEKALASEREFRISELSMLRVLASAGTSVLVFDHSLRAMAGQLLDVVDTLGEFTSDLPEERSHNFEQTLRRLEAWASMTTGQASLVGLLLGSRARTRSDSLAVHPLVESLKEGFQGYTSRFGIEFDNCTPRSVRTPPLHQAELYAVLLNILTNSFKAVRSRSNRRVCVEATVARRMLTIVIHDTGIGVPVEDRERVFEPFVTTSQPDPVLGVGTGLGLKIARDLARAWDGDVCFVEAIEPWRTSVEITIPMR